MKTGLRFSLPVCFKFWPKISNFRLRKGAKEKNKKTKQNQNKTNKRATKKSRYIDTYQANIITTRDGFQEMLSSSKIQT